MILKLNLNQLPSTWEEFPRFSHILNMQERKQVQPQDASNAEYAEYVAHLQQRTSTNFPPAQAVPPVPAPPVPPPAPAVAAPAVAAPAVPEQEPVHPVPVDVGAVMPEKRGGNGSLGHPHLCRRPCIRFSKGECNMGDACEYCHLQHERRPTFDKRQRILMRDMDT